MKQCTFFLLFVGSLLGQTAYSSPLAAQGLGTPRSLPEFNYTEGWLGADDAYSIPLSPIESVWLFGDTFVGNRDTLLRSQAKTMVRNSVGISNCPPGKPCTLRYFWQKPNDPKPRSFFDTGTDDLWYWPMDGFLDGQTLYVSLMAVRNKTGAGPNDVFGFEISGTKLATIANAQASPDKWHVVIEDLTGTRLWAGVSIVPDGKFVIWYTQVSQGEGHGYMTAMRVPRDKMAQPSGTWEYLKMASGKQVCQVKTPCT